MNGNLLPSISAFLGMFNGIRKMIGAKGSSEDLDKSDEMNPVTPCISKSAKKRKVTEASAFSAKKK